VAWKQRPLLYLQGLALAFDRLFFLSVIFLFGAAWLCDSPGPVFPAYMDLIRRYRRSIASINRDFAFLDDAAPKRDLLFDEGL
jgi:hypothetical protein